MATSLVPKIGADPQSFQAFLEMGRGIRRNKEQDAAREEMRQAGIVSQILQGGDRTGALIEQFAGAEADPEFKQELMDLGSIYQTNPADAYGVAEAALMGSRYGQPLVADYRSRMARDQEIARRQQEAQQKQAAQLAEEERKNLSKIREETRGTITKELKTVQDDIGVINTNYNKLVGLGKEIEGGNRQAVAAGLTALVKLGDPNSAVLTGEMQSALNNPNPLAAITEMFDKQAEKGKPVDEGVINAIKTQIDPLNPNLVNVDDFMATAAALVNARVPVIQQRYQESVTLGENLTDAGRKALFTKSLADKVAALSGLATYERPVTEEVVEETQTAPNVIQSGRFKVTVE